MPLLEHTTDTAGYTEIVFALFDLLGLQLSPRIRDLGDQRLFRLDRQKRHPHLGPLLKGRINRDRILRHWDELLRVAGSLKRSWVTASLLIGKLQSYPRKNRLTRTLQEYGRLIKTIFILRYLESEQLRRRINTQLNKGERPSLTAFGSGRTEGLPLELCGPAGYLSFLLACWSDNTEVD